MCDRDSGVQDREGQGQAIRDRGKDRISGTGAGLPYIRDRDRDLPYDLPYSYLFLDGRKAKLDLHPPITVPFTLFISYY